MSKDKINILAYFCTKCYYPSNLLRNAHSFENWGIFSDIPQFYLGDIQSRDVVRPIARERKDLMDYNVL